MTFLCGTREALDDVKRINERMDCPAYTTMIVTIGAMGEAVTSGTSALETMLDQIVVAIMWWGLERMPRAHGRGGASWNLKGEETG